MKSKGIAIMTCLLFLVESMISFAQALADQKSLVLALHLVLMVFALISLVFTLRHEFKGYIRVKNREKINRKIIEFIETTGKTVILSRDLSWVDEATIGRFRQKVTQCGDNLTIFLPRETQTSKTLSEFADVRYYGGIFGDPSKQLTSRFTIIHYGTDSVRVTYPQEDTFWHINTEFAHSDPALTLARDIVKLLDWITKKEPEKESE